MSNTITSSDVREFFIQSDQVATMFVQMTPTPEQCDDLVTQLLIGLSSFDEPDDPEDMQEAFIAWADSHGGSIIDAWAESVIRQGFIAPFNSLADRTDGWGEFVAHWLAIERGVLWTSNLTPDEKLARIVDDEHRSTIEDAFWENGDSIAAVLAECVTDGRITWNGNEGFAGADGEPLTTNDDDDLIAAIEAIEKGWENHEDGPVVEVYLAAVAKLGIEVV